MQENKKKKLSAYYKPYKGLFLADMVFAMIGAAITLVIPLMVRYITGTVVLLPIEEASSTIIRLGIFMVLLVIVEGYCNYFIGYYGHVMGAKIEHDMRNEIFGHYQKLSFAFFDNQKVGHLLSRITSDLFDITELLHHGPEDVVISTIKLVGAFIILLMINAKLALVAIGFVVIMLLYAVGMNNRMRGAFRENRARIADINSQIEDNLSGIRVVKSFANEEIENEKFKKGNDGFLDAKKNSYRYMGGYNAGLTAFTTAITVVVMLSGGVMIARGKGNITDLITFLLYINVFTEPIKTLIDFTEQFQNGYSGFERFMEMISVIPDIKDAPDAQSMQEVKGNISFENVSFHYADSDQMVLNHVNLDVPAGEYVALVGSSGAGKTTLCSLIPRFYDVTGGTIRVDGQDIRNIKLSDLRNHIGIVQQDVYLFAGTILENIRYGKPDASREEVIRAAKEANAHEFIMNFPDGYDTVIGEGGATLSGGEKQRISIARAIMKDAPIVILDEATANVDPENEKDLMDAVDALTKEKTIIMIAHRLKTVRHADQIVVVDKGRIVQQGTHEQLMKQEGIYKRFVDARQQAVSWKLVH